MELGQRIYASPTDYVHHTFNSLLVLIGGEPGHDLGDWFRAERLCPAVTRILCGIQVWPALLPLGETHAYGTLNASRTVQTTAGTGLTV